MTPGRRVARDDLAAAYAAWPGGEHEKTAQKTVLLRLRIEDAAGGTRRVAQRLMLSVGAAGLSDTDRVVRLAAVRHAVAAYQAICDVLHGRDPEGRPPLADIQAWDAVVAALEVNLAGNAAVPGQRRPVQKVR